MASHIISRLVAGKFFLWIDTIAVDWQALHNAARIKVTFMCRLTLHNFLFTFPLTQQRKAAKLEPRRSSVVEAFDASHNYNDLWILSFISGVRVKLFRHHLASCCARCSLSLWRDVGTAGSAKRDLLTLRPRTTNIAGINPVSLIPKN